MCWNQLCVFIRSLTKHSLAQIVHLVTKLKHYCWTTAILYTVYQPLFLFKFTDVDVYKVKIMHSNITSSAYRGVVSLALSKISLRVRVRVRVSIVYRITSGGYSWIWPSVFHTWTSPAASENWLSGWNGSPLYYAVSWSAVVLFHASPLRT